MNLDFQHPHKHTTDEKKREKSCDKEFWEASLRYTDYWAFSGRMGSTCNAGKQNTG